MKQHGLLVAAIAIVMLSGPSALDHHGPPQEAIDACAKLRDGDTCSFTHHGHNVDGSCRTGPDGSGALACAPKNMPPPACQRSRSN